MSLKEKLKSVITEELNNEFHEQSNDDNYEDYLEITKENHARVDMIVKQLTSFTSQFNDYLDGLELSELKTAALTSLLLLEAIAKNNN
ncbi:MAG: hypothetical protein JEZ01_21160 [Labilibaculum sp.]|nr:hypothetical protein [Labilibaculum sp.]MBI9060290.1 hypothetical protein [Labilibaculum sp.]